MEGLFKLVLGFVTCVCVAVGLETELPDWAIFIGFSVLMAGFIAHKGD